MKDISLHLKDQLHTYVDIPISIIFLLYSIIFYNIYINTSPKFHFIPLLLPIIEIVSQSVRTIIITLVTSSTIIQHAEGCDEFSAWKIKILPRT